MTAHIVAAVLVRGDQVLLGHRSPHRRSYPDVWDLIGGHVEAGERPTAALVRELREELGITVPEPAGPPLATISTTEFTMGVWRVDTWTGTVTNTAPDEHDELAWLTLDQLPGRPLADDRYVPLLTSVLSTPPRT